MKNTDIPTDSELLEEELVRFKQLDKKYRHFLSESFKADQQGKIDTRDLNRLLEAFGFQIVRAKGCKQGFSPSSTSLMFKKFVNNTLAKTAARRKIKA